MAAGNDDDEHGGGDGNFDRSHIGLVSGTGGRRSAEKALEEAACTGSISLSGRRLRGLPGAARSTDLTDVTRADLSRNRFSEVPGELCQLISLESLNLYHNCLRTLPAALANLQVLTYLNISRNLLTALPPYLCHLPLTVLIASNNKLISIPEEMGGMSNLRQLDISCNDIESLPPQMGSMESLRELNVRRNQLTVLPKELAELPLIRLDFSCNRIARIPLCYRHLRHLQTIVLDNNPLQYPPAQICLKGKVHIFKYLNLESCDRAAPDLRELGKLNRPTSFTTCLTDDMFSTRVYGGLDSGFNSVDSGSKRWSGNESADELSEVSFRAPGLSRDSRPVRDKPNARDTAQENQEETDCGLHLPATPQDKHKLELHSTPMTEERTLVSGPLPSPPSPASRRNHSMEERRKPETLLIWRERERQQLQQKQETLWRPSVERRDSGASEDCTGIRNQGCLVSNPTSPTSHLTDPSQAPSPKPNSFLFRSSSRGAVRSTASGSDQCSGENYTLTRFRSPPSPSDDTTVLLQLQKDIECHLNITLGDPVCESLANGVILCQLVNHLRPRFIPFINVPSPAVPRLNAVKCRKNVDRFLDACRRLGVPERDLCLASDILGGEDPRGVQRTVCSLLLLCASRDAPVRAISALSDEATSCSLQLLYQHHGFLLFYTLLMLVVYVTYHKLCMSSG